MRILLKTSAHLPTLIMYEYVEHTMRVMEEQNFSKTSDRYFRKYCNFSLVL